MSALDFLGTDAIVMPRQQRYPHQAGECGLCKGFEIDWTRPKDAATYMLHGGYAYLLMR